MNRTGERRAYRGDLPLTLCMGLILLPTTALAAGPRYMGESGAQQNFENAAAGTGVDTEWTEGWYIVSGEDTVNSRATVIGGAVTATGGITGHRIARSWNPAPTQFKEKGGRR